MVCGGKPYKSARCLAVPGICTSHLYEGDGCNIKKNMSEFDYKSKRWKHIAKAVMRRDGYICQISKRYGKNIPAE